MSWAEERARLLGEAPPAPTRQPFTPGLPHFVQVGPNQWVETPYALAHCVFCPEELAKGDRIMCSDHREQSDAYRMPWEADR